MLKVKGSSVEDGVCESNLGSKLDLGMKLEIVKAMRVPGADAKPSFQTS